jgi:hypothetical protein
MSCFPSVVRSALFDQGAKVSDPESATAFPGGEMEPMRPPKREATASKAALPDGTMVKDVMVPEASKLTR